MPGAGRIPTRPRRATERSLLIDGGKRPDGTPSAGVLVVEGRIAAIGDDAAAGVPKRTRRLDATGLTVAPGLIELQVNGAGGRDITADPTAIWSVGECLAEFGVTSFLPTIVSSPPEVAATAQRVLREGPRRGYRGATPLGLHVEGPFLNPARRGAHDAGQLRAPDAKLAASWSRDAGVRLVTLAPELPGALDVVMQLVRRGVVVSAGHSMATAEEARRAFDAGVSYATHLFNAMPPLDHRAPGLAGAALADPRVTVGVIADGHHVDPLAIALAWRLKGPQRFSLVSDAVAALGTTSGSHTLGRAGVSLDGEGAARLSDGRLAGGTIGLDAALRNLIEFAAVSRAEALGTVTSTPAHLLGLDDRGRLEIGMRGDVTLFGEDLQVVATIVGGDVVYAADDRVA
jgi:N-acetylglucosamine-6-phosphate deacetylase